MRDRSARLGSLFLLIAAGTACSSGPTEPACASTPAASRSAFACVSDAELLRLISDGGGIVMVGFKEAGTARGVDTTGHSVTSEETTLAMKGWLVARGVRFTWQSAQLPSVAGHVPLRLDLVQEIRRHPNVDYLEPRIPGTFDGS